MAAHRYWRINITQKGSDATFCNIAEVQLRASIGGADETGSGTASASSTQSGFPAFNAVDNSNSTMWAFNTAAPASWKYDFGAGNDKDIVELAIISGPSAGYQCPTTFSLDYSDDDSAWTTLFTITDDPVWGNTETRTFSANDGPTINGNKTFWRIKATANKAGTSFLGIAEVEMATALYGADQCTGGKAYSNPPAQDSGTAPSKGFDDSNSTLTVNRSGWSMPMWLGYRFAAAKDIAQVKITARNDSTYAQAPKNFVIEYWDGAAYQTALTVTGEDWGQGQTKTFYIPANITTEVVGKENAYAMMNGDVGAELTRKVTSYAVLHGDSASADAKKVVAYAVIDSSVSARPVVFVAT